MWGVSGYQGVARGSAGCVGTKGAQGVVWGGRRGVRDSADPHLLFHCIWTLHIGHKCARAAYP